MASDFKNFLCSRVHFNITQDLKNTILLAGTGRSGTTWISNILNFDNEYRYIFEPFSNTYTKECHGFAYKQYLRENDNREYFIRTARMVFSGKIGNKWIDKFNKRLFCKKKLVKDIRVNFLLKWIRKHFPEIRIIFVIRHPIAVAYSRMKLGWDTHLEEILDQDELIEDFISDKIAKIKDCNSEFEKHIYLWCLENYVPLKTLVKSDAYVVSYEKFCLQPEQESQRLLHWVGKVQNYRLQVAISTPSKVSSKFSAVNTGDDLVSKWQKEISIEGRIKAVKILSLFEMDKYYNEGLLPVQSFNFPE